MQKISKLGNFKNIIKYNLPDIDNKKMMPKSFF